MTCPCAPRGAPQFDPDREGPSDADLERFGGDMRPCPVCRSSVYDGATVCPSCGAWLEDAPAGGVLKRALFTAGLIAAGVAFILVFVL
ncbi:MAG: hypothetical protein D6693_05085 [Planctomycetota bacterium]|nr:MAG: hypothetical protein D6693_05085 [Planctomycetota bacterium]